MPDEWRMLYGRIMQWRCVTLYDEPSSLNPGSVPRKGTSVTSSSSISATCSAFHPVFAPELLPPDLW